MYIFRIIDMVDRSKAWYRGEWLADEAYYYTTAVSPIDYPVNFSGGHAIGDKVDRYGYTYVSLKDNNSDQPEWNYVGNPVATDGELYGLNSWIRVDYANKAMMAVPESGGITESYSGGISGTLKMPTGSSAFWERPEAATCMLLCGVLGSAVSINGSAIYSLDTNGSESSIGNPESSGLNSAATISLDEYPTGGFPFSITKSSNSVSTYCAGAYIGSWSYLGKTQWTNHKKQVNDYSNQSQNEWGNYELAKKRTGRTYSADVILAPREGAEETDYDYSMDSLCFSVHQLLMSVLGKCSAFYFNNQDIGVPWIPHNSDLAGQTIKLVDSDIIVGVLQSFEISDIQGNRAMLKLSVNSVPNEYKNYSDVSGITPSYGPTIPTGTFPALTYAECYLSSNDSAIYYGDTINFSASELTDCFYIVPTPLESAIGIYSIETYDTSGLSMSWVWDEEQEGYIVTVVGDKLAATYEYEIVPYSTDHQRITVKVKTTGTAKNYIRIILRYWEASSNTYEAMPYFKQFYIQTSV